MQTDPTPANQPPDGYVEIGTPEQLTALYSALATAQQAFTEIKRTVTVNVEHRGGGRHTFKYAPLELLHAATQPALSANGLIVLSPIVSANGTTGHVVTILAHKDGGRIMASFGFAQMPDIKDTGGRITYLRRYSYSALLNLAADEDSEEKRSQDAGAARTRAPAANRPAEAANSHAQAQNPAAASTSPQKAAQPPRRPPAKPGELVLADSPEWQEHLRLMAVGESLGLAIIKSASSFRVGMSLQQLQAFDTVLAKAIEGADLHPEAPPAAAAPAGPTKPATVWQRDRLYDLAERLVLDEWTDPTTKEHIDLNSLDWGDVTDAQAERWWTSLHGLAQSWVDEILDDDKRIETAKSLGLIAEEEAIA